VLRYTLMTPPSPTSPESSPSADPVVTRSMISHLYFWAAKSASASAAGTSARTNGWSAFMISRMRASMAARSSSEKVRPPGSSKS